MNFQKSSPKMSRIVFVWQHSCVLNNFFMSWQFATYVRPMTVFVFSWQSHPKQGDSCWKKNSWRITNDRRVVINFYVSQRRNWNEISIKQHRRFEGKKPTSNIVCFKVGNCDWWLLGIRLQYCAPIYVVTCTLAPTPWKRLQRNKKAKEFPIF